ncbi:MAG: ribosome-associated translation inhibitor RaiA [Rhodobiaceae bacterium]|nr:ribosome-associated translation inhibitor RaiA [Rhodobiaceae bacterium]
MTVQIIGKNINIGDSLRTRVGERLEFATGKYFDGGYSGHVSIEKARSGFTTECAVHLDTGIVLHTHGEGDDAYLAFDRAAERLEKRLRRYKRRLKTHNTRGPAEEAISYVIAQQAEDDEDIEPEGEDTVIVAERPARIPVLTVADAVMALDLGAEPALVFRNAGSGRMNVVYRRHDGHVGWVDPQTGDS